MELLLLLLNAFTIIGKPIAALHHSCVNYCLGRSENRWEALRKVVGK